MLTAELFLEAVIVLKITRNNEKFLNLLKVGESSCFGCNLCHINSNGGEFGIKFDRSEGKDKNGKKKKK